MSARLRHYHIGVTMSPINSFNNFIIRLQFGFGARVEFYEAMTLLMENDGKRNWGNGSDKSACDLTDKGKLDTITMKTAILI